MSRLTLLTLMCGVCALWCAAACLLRGRRVLCRLTRAGAVLYVLAVAVLTVGFRLMYVRPVLEYRLALIPFREADEYWLLSSFLPNVLLFVPLTMLLCAAGERPRYGRAVLFALVFCLIIETAQLVTRIGIFDADDIIANTLGGAAGAGLYRLIEQGTNRFAAKEQAKDVHR